MTTTTSTTKSYGASSANGGDQLAGAIDQAARSGQHTIDQALDSLSNKVEEATSQVAPLLDRLSAQAGAATKRAIDAVRESSRQVRHEATRVGDTTVAYVRDEPVKAVLLAAATGALLMGLIGLVRRSRQS